MTRAQRASQISAGLSAAVSVRAGVRISPTAKPGRRSALFRTICTSAPAGSCERLAASARACAALVPAGRLSRSARLRTRTTPAIAPCGGGSSTDISSHSACCEAISVVFPAPRAPRTTTCPCASLAAPLRFRQRPHSTATTTRQRPASSTGSAPVTAGLPRSGSVAADRQTYGQQGGDGAPRPCPPALAARQAGFAQIVHADRAGPRRR